jgi:hypothetical protein
MSDNPMVHICADHTFPRTEENNKERIISMVCSICGKVLSVRVFPKQRVN